MAQTISFAHDVKAPGANLTNTPKSVSGSALLVVDESVANGQTNSLVACTLDVSAVKGLYLISDQDVLVETNDGTTPDDTISLKANQPYLWHTDAYDALIFAADITALYVTNASGSAAAIKMYAVTDATP